MIQINKDYPANNTNYSFRANNKIEYIVIHYVGALGGSEANAKYYSSTEYIGASAHFFVGHASEGAAVYQSVDPKYRAWHCGSETGKYYHDDCRNENSIGIEMCCHKTKDGVWYFDRKTIEKTAEFTAELMQKYNIPPERVIRHYDVTHKRCPAPFVNDPEAWKKFKEMVTPMTIDERKEFDKLKEAVKALEKTVYKKIEEVPSWYRPTIEKLVKKGYLKGDESGLNLTEEAARVYTILDRTGVFDK